MVVAVAAALSAACGRSVGDPAAAPPSCPPGVVAQTRAADLAVSNGWTRLVLSACPGAPKLATRLEVDGADHRLAYTPGRAGGVTSATLTAGASRSGADPQTFAVPPGSARAREVVLAPWPFGLPPPRLGRIRLLAAGRD